MISLHFSGRSVELDEEFDTDDGCSFIDEDVWASVRQNKWLTSELTTES